MKKVIGSMVSVICLLAGSVTVHAADLEKIKKQCAECHEKDGNSKDDNTPRIAGMSKAYLKLGMEDYLNDKRPARTVKRKDKPDTDMKKVLKDLSKDDIEQIAEYFSKQKYQTVKQKFDAGLASGGDDIHNKYCRKCHEQIGRSPSDDAGYLGGQHLDYLKYTFDNFQKGKRAMPKKMKKKWEKMVEKDGDKVLEQLLNYYASVQD